MSNISFFHIASVYPKSTENIIKNVRIHHPNDFYFLGVDGVNTRSYEYLVEPYKLNYRHFYAKVGGPVSNYGYYLDGTLEFLRRFRAACALCKTSHIMMIEDDVLLIKPVTVEPEWEMACHNIESWGNKLPDLLLEKIENYSGYKPKIGNYCAGGGSIFKVSTFLENYDRIVKWFEDNFNEIQSYYPTIGYIDCFMNVYYYLCGKDYIANPYMVDTHNHIPGFDYEEFINRLPKEIQIINNYKKYYYE